MDNFFFKLLKERLEEEHREIPEVVMAKAGEEEQQEVTEE